MKKLFVIAALAVATISGQAIAADSVTLEGQSIQGRDGAADAKNFNMTFRRDINSFLSGHVQANGTQTDTTNALSSRIEAGITGSIKLVGPFSGYTTVAAGEAFKASGNYSYYSVEPGIRTDLGSGLTARVGYRHRAAFDSGIADTTGTARVGLSYALNKQDSIGIRYDRVMQDVKQDVFAVSYTRSF